MIIKKIDIAKNKVELVVRGCNTPISLKVEEVIFDLTMLSSISSQVAAHLGYYYGINFYKFTSELKKRSLFSIQHHSINYCCSIISINRQSYVKFLFLDKENRKEMVMHPLQIIEEPSLVSRFHPTQACYLGFLAGTAAEKLQKRLFQNQIL